MTTAISHLKKVSQAGVTLIELIIALSVIGAIITLGFSLGENYFSHQLRQQIAQEDGSRIAQFATAVNNFVQEAENNGSNSNAYPNESDLSSPITFTELVKNGNISPTFGVIHYNGTTLYGYTKTGQQLVAYVNTTFGFPTSIGVFAINQLPGFASRYGFANYLEYNSFSSLVAIDAATYFSDNNNSYFSGIVGLPQSNTYQNFKILHTSDANQTAKTDNLVDFFDQTIPVANNQSGRESPALFINLQENPGYLLLLVQGYGNQALTGTTTQAVGQADWAIYDYGYSSFCPGGPTNNPYNNYGANITQYATSIVPITPLAAVTQSYQGNSYINLGQDYNSASSPYPDATGISRATPTWAEPSSFLNTYVCLPATQAVVNQMVGTPCTKNPNSCLLFAPNSTTSAPAAVENSSGTNNGSIWVESTNAGANTSNTWLAQVQNSANDGFLINFQLGSSYYTLAGWNGTAYLQSPDVAAGYAPMWRDMVLGVFSGAATQSYDFNIMALPFDWHSTPNNEPVNQYFNIGPIDVTGVTSTNINLLTQPTSANGN